MALTAAQKDKAWQKLVADITAAGPMTLTQPQLVAAATALDDFLDTNAAAINAAIPLPARTTLTTPQKALLMAAVTLERWGG